MVDVVELAKSKAQVNAAETSLKTNVMLVLVVVVMFAGFALPSDVNAVITAFIKGLLPLAIAVVNFAKIQQVLATHWQNLWQNIKPG